MAHQVVDDYQSMNFEFPDEYIMMITDCKNLGPYDRPEQGSLWAMVFDGASNALCNEIGDVIISPEGCHTLSLIGCVSTVQITWLNTKHASWA